ncbi:MAG: hypothetical protein BroJett042_23030 [Bacteroidota bacterium]|nr:MAG: hypothetical protein BroJett042_23030 [Bacteroidota bacterium]
MKYKTAPIQEAVFDVRIDRIGVQSVEELKRYKDQLPKEYQNEKKKVNFSGLFQVADNKELETKTRGDLTGFVYSTVENNKQIQVRLDGFTFNVLRPYDKWEVHFSEFLKAWTEYKNLFQPSSVVRIATRFINRIEIPIPFKDFEEYIINMPPIPKGLPQIFNSFFMQIQVPCEDNLRNAIITETMEPATEKILPFILDIDVFQERSITFDNLAENFDQIRAIKNQVFENCITDQTRKLFS